MQLLPKINRGHCVLHSLWEMQYSVIMSTNYLNNLKKNRHNMEDTDVYNCSYFKCGEENPVYVHDGIMSRSVVQPKIAPHQLQSNKLSTVLNFLLLFRHLWEIISYISVPLRCLLKSCQRVQSNSGWRCPISVTRQAGEQYSSQKQWSTVEMLSVLSFFVSSEYTLTALQSWASRRF